VNRGQSRKKEAGAPLSGGVRVDAARFLGFTAMFLALWANHAAAHPAATALQFLTGH